MEPGKEYYNEERAICCMCGTNSVKDNLRTITEAEHSIVARLTTAINVSPLAGNLVCKDENYCGRMVAAKLESAKT